MKTLSVTLTKKWSHYEAGEVVTLEAGKAKRICAKGFGTILKGKKAAQVPPLENTMMPPVSEMAVAGPQRQEQPMPSDES